MLFFVNFGNTIAFTIQKSTRRLWEAELNDEEGDVLRRLDGSERRVVMEDEAGYAMPLPRDGQSDSFLIAPLLSFNPVLASMIQCNLDEHIPMYIPCSPPPCPCDPHPIVVLSRPLRTPSPLTHRQPSPDEQFFTPVATSAPRLSRVSGLTEKMADGKKEYGR